MWAVDRKKEQMYVAFGGSDISVQTWSLLNGSTIAPAIPIATVGGTLSGFALFPGSNIALISTYNRSQVVSLETGTLVGSPIDLSLRGCLPSDIGSLVCVSATAPYNTEPHYLSRVDVNGSRTTWMASAPTDWISFVLDSSRSVVYAITEYAKDREYRMNITVVNASTMAPLMEVEGMPQLGGLVGLSPDGEQLLVYLSGMHTDTKITALDTSTMRPLPWQVKSPDASFSSSCPLRFFPRGPLVAFSTLGGISTTPSFIVNAKTGAQLLPNATFNSITPTSGNQLIGFDFKTMSILDEEMNLVAKPEWPETVRSPRTFQFAHGAIITSAWSNVHQNMQYAMVR